MPSPLIPTLLRYFPAACTGLLLTAAFPGIGFFHAAFFALVPLWASLAGLSPGRAFKAGLVAGLVHFLTLIYWLVPTLTLYGGLTLGLALATLMLLCLYLAVYPALFAWLMVKFRPPSSLAPLWGAAAWTGLEWLRTHALTGFPWGVLGYSQAPNTLLVQMADLFGVLGISFVVVVCNGTLAVLWAKASSAMAILPHSATRTRDAAIPFGYGLVIVCLALGYGAFRLPQSTLEAAAAPQLTIAVIQGNIEQDKKWSDAFKSETVKRYGDLSLAKAPADLIVWPETALPFYYGRDPLFSSRVDEIVRSARCPFLFGSPAAEFQEETVRYFNRAYMLTPLAMVSAYYDKTHLVPFGEYVPFQDLLFFVKKITSEAGNFSAGTTGRTPLAFGSHGTGVLICFEILFPDIAREFVLNGADLLTTMTNDAWFGKTSAPAQHFDIAVLRAVENRRALVRAANTGISGFILPTGEVTAATGLFETTGLARKVPAMTGTTFFTRYGDFPGMAALIAILLVFMVKPGKNTYRRFNK